jgi:prepilin-type N-terminal cleavage/methylation domain-containing protein
MQRDVGLLAGSVNNREWLSEPVWPRSSVAVRPRPSRACHSCSGFSLVELMFVILIVLIVSAIALIQVRATLAYAKTDAALQTTLGTMRRVHELAIDQRRVYRVSIIAPRTIQTDQVAFDAFGNRTFVFVASIDLPTETQFVALTGIPTAVGTTPDGLGGGVNAIDLNVDNGGGGTQVYFQPDGRALDNNNRINSGVVYIARPADLLSSRAVSILGSTGRSKPWRLMQKPDLTKEWRQ